MEKLIWFKFNISDWMMGKIMKCPEVTQARFIRLCCLYWNKECMLSHEDAEIEVDEDHLKILLSKKIVMSIDGFINIKFLDEQNEGILETSEKRRNAVKKRWERVKQNDTSVSKKHTSVLQSDTEKRREEQRREEQRREEDIKTEKYDSNLLDEIMIFYNFTEVSNFDKMRDINFFINVLTKNKRIDYFKTQFKSYVELKNKNPAFKHSFKNFIGSALDLYEDGAWNEENWTEKLKVEKNKSNGTENKNTQGRRSNRNASTDSEYSAL